MIPLFFTDPVGDNYGLGYAYPRAALFAEAGFADLTRFEAVEKDGKVVLRVQLNRYPNPNNAPNGFSLATIAIYVDTGPGGQKEMPGAGFRTPEGQEWDRAYLVTGWLAEERRPDGQTQPIQVQKIGDWLELYPSLPSGDYGYYVTVGVYDPFTLWYFRPVQPGGGTWIVDGPSGGPAAVDVLSTKQIQAYQTGVLSPTKALQNRIPWAILSAGLGLLMILLAFRFPRR